MEYPRVEPNPKESATKTVYKVKLTPLAEVEVTVTSKISVARRWIRAARYFNDRHSHLKVGIATHGVNPSVLTLANQRKCLVVHLEEALQNGPIGGKLARFLRNRSVTFVSYGLLSVGTLPLRAYKYVDEVAYPFARLTTDFFGNELALDPVVAASDWAASPLTHEQVILTSMKACVAYVAAL